MGEDRQRAARLEKVLAATKGVKFWSPDLGWAFRATARGHKGLVLGVWLDGPLRGAEARVPLDTLKRLVSAKH